MRMSDERSTILKKIRGSQNSLGFWTPCCEFQIPGTEFQIVCQWNLDSRSKNVGGWWFSRLLELYSGFQSPKSGFHKQKIPGYWIPDSLT